MATSLEKLIEMAERLNLKGKEVQEFVKTQQKLEKEAREAERMQKEADRKAELELEKEKTVREKEAREAEEKSDRAKFLRQKEIEQQRVNFEKETENEKYLKQREIEKERFEKEEKLRSDERIQELAPMKHDMEMRKLEIASQSNDVDANTDSHNSSRSEHRGNKNRLPRLPVLGPSDKIDAYLSRFEQYAELSEWPKDLWAVQLSMLLTNKALEVYHRLSLEGNVDYEVLKKNLLKYFDFTEAGFKKKFRESKIENNETPSQFLVRMSTYFDRWYDLSGTSKNFDDLRNFVIKDQFLNLCTKEVRTFIKERQAKSFEELCKMADLFVDSHEDRNLMWKPSDGKFKSNDGKFDANKGKFDGNKPGSKFNKSGTFVRRCFLCDSTQHISRDCNKSVKNQNDKGKFGAMEENAGAVNSSNQGEKAQQNINGNWRQNSSKWRSKERCEKHGYFNCRFCKEVTQKCAAMDISNDECETMSAGACGEVRICEVDKIVNPLARGRVNHINVTTMRDTGCSSVCVQESLVKPQDYTGKFQKCKLIDGTIKNFPKAKINIQTPFLSGNVEAVVMKRPLYPLIIGNVEKVTLDFE